MNPSKSISTVGAILLLAVSLREQEIHEAVRQGDIERVQSLVGENADLVNSKNPDGVAPLHLCASSGNAEIMEYLLEKGADIHIRNKYGWTALHFAAHGGHKEIMELLAASGADVNATDNYGLPILFRAVQGSRAETAEFLLSRGADPNYRIDLGITPLFWAVNAGDREMVELLEAHGGDLRCRMNDGGTLLHLAASNGKDETGRYLISRGLDVNAEKRYGVTPLHLAAVFGHMGMAGCLIENGARIDASSPYAGTPIHLAVAGGQDEMAEYLLSQGAKNPEREFPELHGEYFGMNRPGMKPEIFAPGVMIHAHWPHSPIIFSNDGTEAWWSATSFYGDFQRVWFMKQENGRWRPPHIAPFCKEGDYIDGGPFLSPDGDRLYFMSTRPLERGGEIKDPDLWYVERLGDGWGAPINPGAPVNTSAAMGYGTMSDRGTLYFQCANCEGSRGLTDIYMARWADGKFTPPENLGSMINSEYFESTPYIAPDESYLLFVSNRPGGYGRQSEIYVSFNGGGAWAEPRNLGEIINVGQTTCPYVTPDGKYLFFISERDGSRDFYWVDAGIIEEVRSENRDEARPGMK